MWNKFRLHKTPYVTARIQGRVFNNFFYLLDQACYRPKKAPIEYTFYELVANYQGIIHKSDQSMNYARIFKIYVVTLVTMDVFAVLLFIMVIMFNMYFYNNINLSN